MQPPYTLLWKPKPHPCAALEVDVYAAVRNSVLTISMVRADFEKRRERVFIASSLILCAFWVTELNNNAHVKSIIL